MNFLDQPKVELATASPVALRPRNPLRWTLTPEYWKLDPAHYDDITPKMRAAASPGQLYRTLVDVPQGSPAAVSYVPGGAKRSGYIALTPQEYGLIPRDVDSFNRSIRNTTLASRPQGDEHVEAADRSVQHALEVKRSKLEVYEQDTLKPWGSVLEQFRKAAKDPNLSLLGPEETMRIRFETFRTSILGNMLDALREQRNWTDRQYDFAQRTIEARMLLDTDNNSNITYFAQLVAASGLYVGHKTALFRDRIYKVKTLEKQIDAE